MKYYQDTRTKPQLDTLAEIVANSDDQYIDDLKRQMCGMFYNFGEKSANELVAALALWLVWQRKS